MPLITTSITPEPPPPVTTPGSGTPVPLPGIGRATATYIDPTGAVWPLTEPYLGWFTLADGVSGLGAAPVTLTTDPHARGGARLRHVQPQPRTIVWPLHVYGDNHDEFLARWRTLATAFTRTLREGAGVLEIARPDGSRRRISVVYQEGYEGDGGQGSGRTSDSAVLTLWCSDPYWTDPEPVAVHRETGATGSFFTPYPTVSSSQLLGETTLTNPGDVTVWPTWTVTGPASAITFTTTRQTLDGETTEAFTLNPNAAAVGHGNLLAGEQVTISTDPPRVVFEDGANWIGGLDWPTAVLWGLAPGANAVTFALSGSGPGSAVDLTFYARYETA